MHSHDDGVIHWHPFTSAAVGKRATLGVFLENYGVELTDDSLKFPPEQNGGQEYIEGETKCPDGKDGELSVTVWQSPDDTSSGDRYVSGFDDIRMTKNSLVITIAFQPRGTEVGKPEPQSSQLEELGAVDSGQVPTAQHDAGHRCHAGGGQHRHDRQHDARHGHRRAVGGDHGGHDSDDRSARDDHRLGPWRQRRANRR